MMPPAEAGVLARSAAEGTSYRHLRPVLRRDVIRMPAILAGAMLLIGAATCLLSAVNPLGLVFPYILAGFGVTATSLFIYVFIGVAKLFPERPDKPLQIILRRLRPRLALLVLPAIIFPLFLSGYTAAKTAIPFLVGYSWDAFWAASDRLIFGDDAWRITHAWLGTWSMPAWEWLYTFGWGATLGFSTSLITLYASPRRIGVFFSAMSATWLLGGWLMAYGFSAAGPVFAPLLHPELAAAFDPLRALLASSLDPNHAIASTQRYLTQAMGSYEALKGGGISAMPSMHIGAASIYVLAARGTKWLVPALLFWMMIFIGSAHFGYHYWVDGLAAAAIAWLCWYGAESYFGVRAKEAAAVSN